jgi:hypothetical protein
MALYSQTLGLTLLADTFKGYRPRAHFAAIMLAVYEGAKAGYNV